MHRTEFFLAVVVVAVLGMSMYGCTPSQPAAKPSIPADQAPDANGQPMDHDDHQHEGHEHDGDVGAADTEAIKTQLEKLLEVERMAVEKQQICPVSGEILGTVGVPLKVTVNRQDVWLCCGGCMDELLASPDEFFAKLPK